ncbi:pleckstrin homology domain-containing family A member 2 [Lacerta agilis]|uniref:pleckstrin homology domain-containing family A member 2 n=1 Tax=Lacerta agilis TaxID=80427 RepID=UPI001419D2C0|nr:pleckstrin homology domain-containing family A member 2 [Lacerta agilis]XP_033027827.1 pleckstrin homology domain-containing family A member 2 [Lacerta agilis]
MPYVDRQNRICGFLDIEDNESCGKFLRRYFILDTQANSLLWYMDNPQNLAVGAKAVGSLQLTYISKVSVAPPKQKPKTSLCFVINALSQRYVLQANDQKDLQDWVEALNRASKITVPKGESFPPTAEVVKSPYRTEIIGGVVVQTPISVNQNGGDGSESGEPAVHPLLKRSQSYIPSTKTPTGPPVLKSGYCVKQGNVRKSWKRRYFTLDDFSISYFKCEQDKEPLRSILLKDVLKTHECLVKSGDLLMRDNLFEITTSYRTFYIQAYSPEDMHSWIREINGAVQALKSCPRDLVRSVSVNKRGGPSSAMSSIERLKHLGGEPKASAKSPSASCWLPWMPVPQSEGKPQPAAEQKAGLQKDSEFSPLFSQRDARATQGGRLRHRSEPQNFKEHPFPFDLDDESIRTSDV